MSTVAGITLPMGNVAAIQAAAAFHRELQGSLNHEASVLEGQASSLDSTWTGDAATAAQAYTKITSNHFMAAAEAAGVTATQLTNFANELEAIQAKAKGLQSQASGLEDTIANLKLEVSTDPTKQAAVSSALTHAYAELAHLHAAGVALNERAATLSKDLNATLNHTAVVPPPALPSAPTVPIVATAATGTVALPAVTPSAPASTSAPAPATDTATGAPQAATQPANVAPTQVPSDLAPVASGATQGAITFGDLEKIGKQYGWSSSQDAAWWKVISLESGGNPGATNPSSGAYGIGQFLGGTLTEYTPYGAASPHPMDQLNAMARYIHDRYGTPSAALTFHLANNWY